jgi:subtilisin family serine protease
VEGGHYLGDQETERSSFVDRIGHGTAVAAAIRDKAPDVELLAVRIFDAVLATNADRLASAIVWSADQGARLVNVSLGTPNPARESVLREAVDYAVSSGAIVISAYEVGFDLWLPGSLSGAVGVNVDWHLSRDEVSVDESREPALWRASGLPRPIPGVPPERNLSGVSFAVANVTGFLARLLEGTPVTAASDLPRLLEQSV